MSDNGKIEEEINGRIESASRLLWSIRSKFLNGKKYQRKLRLLFTDRRLFRLCHMTVNHGHLKKPKNKLQATEMCYLRKV